MTTELVVPEFDLADRMRLALRKSPLSVNDMAAELGVRRETVSSWLNGHTRPLGPAVRMWASLTSVPLEWLDPDWYTPRDSNPEPAGSEDLAADQQRSYWTLAA